MKIVVIWGKLIESFLLLLLLRICLVYVFFIGYGGRRGSFCVVKEKIQKNKKDINIFKKNVVILQLWINIVEDAENPLKSRLNELLI